MADIYMTNVERNDISVIMDKIKLLPPKEQFYVLGVADGLAYKNIPNAEEKQYAEGSTNK